MDSSKSALLVLVVAAALLIFASVPTSALRYTSISRFGGGFQLHAGFGPPNPKVKVSMRGSFAERFSKS
jgi:hypothetical protein